VKYLFFIGNKRCGTTLMVNLLNLHPRVFVSHESDIIWTLYQIGQGIEPGQHSLDGGLGISITLEKCAHLLDQFRDVQHIFDSVTQYLMVNGSEIQMKYDKSDLLWMGDKKPVQCCDPIMLPFLKMHFPGAVLIHMVRHPVACVASKMTAAPKAIDADYTR